jgi:recombination associated protein RdgC
VVDAANLAKADELIEMLVKTIDGIALTQIKTNISPSAAMTSWIVGDDLSSVFTIDRDCELRGAGEEKSTVRYVRHTLESEEIAKHITAGKEVTRLAMTWNDKVSFVLHENLQLKRLSPLDILKDQADGNDQEDMFDADFAIMTGEIQKLLSDIIDTLGGETNSANLLKAA